jgi:DMSO/TMAO reductase YedYZ molybdopterin-dependent catalytic subunit
MTDRVDLRDAVHDRLPPGQIVTRKWPVLHYGTVPPVNLATWRFEVTGAVKSPLSLRWEELLDLPRRETVCDMHCVTRWTRYDNVFEGVPVQEVLARAGVKPGAAYVLVHAEQNYTTNLPLADLDRPANLLALSHNGEPLTPEHGGPVRLLVPHLYLWKSAKWVRGITLHEHDDPGFWEQNGYHTYGDPWKEQRYW